MSGAAPLSPEAIFRANGGQLRMGEALAAGISRYQLYQLRDKGLIEAISRGLYRLSDLPPISNPDLVAVASRYPKAVLCLVSALAWHGITTQIPHQVHIAVARQARLPEMDYPPVQGYRFSAAAFEKGIENHSVDDTPIRIYSPEKTLADCFKFRNKIGMEVALEALQLYRERFKTKPAIILQYAKLCRVEQIMRPYLEAGL
ncbi:type IV toxin-antitoxin system AbiEi family antitoxin domain-containing protein [Teredinibacter turnerae]|uniref:type IV toxin-antitoxin system AbiEi family antitoxin domain-containing protein n=1 Tax=Teredinibacter turnerae TaxID=2426 RepID=UPI0030CDD8F9